MKLNAEILYKRTLCRFNITESDEVNDFVLCEFLKNCSFKKKNILKVKPFICHGLMKLKNKMHAKNIFP